MAMGTGNRLSGFSDASSLQGSIPAIFLIEKPKIGIPKYRNYRERTAIKISFLMNFNSPQYLKKP